MLRDRLRRRREKQARVEARRAQLLEEYVAKADAGDPDTLEASRDYADNTGGSWNVEVGVAAAVVLLFVSVGALTALFAGIQYLIGQ